MSEDESKAWHRDHRLQIGHIVATFALALTVAGTLVQVTTFLGKMDSRVTVLEAQGATQATAQRDRDERQDKTTTEALNMLHQQLDKIDSKLDRLVEKRK